MPWLGVRIPLCPQSFIFKKIEYIIIMGRYRSGQTGQTVNLLAHAFSGSNPLLPNAGLAQR